MILFVNGRIRTMNPAQPFATAMVVANGRILAVGSDDQIKQWTTPSTITENLEGRTIWPGLTDAHLHLEHFSRGLHYIDCETTSRSECLQKVAVRSQQAPINQWIRGHGWNQNVWPEGFGTAQQLDQVSFGHPVYLTAKSLHASWANSLALKIAGITSQTPDPEGGRIGRDEFGQPNGLLFENAMQLIEKIIPELSPDQLIPIVKTGQETLLSMGLTGIHDFDGVNCFSALEAMDREGSLILRVVKSIPHKSLEHAIQIGLRSGFGSDHLRLGSVKLFADGALGPRTASMLQPYEGETANRGILLLDSEQIFEIGRLAVNHGLSLAIHAIGDMANHQVLKGYAQLRDFELAQNLQPARHRIEHVQLIHPTDQIKMERLKIIASMQPLHATSDMFIADQFWGQRSENSYALNALNKLGIYQAFGSDAPVESPNPFFGMHAAVTRCRVDGSPGSGGWHPDQKLSFIKALQGYTLGPAYAGYFEKDLGQLAPGFFADFITFDQDPFDLPSDQIWRLSPSGVVIGGNWIKRN